MQTIKVHPKDSKVIYTAIDWKIFKTKDGGNAWELLYTDTNQDLVTDFQIDGYNPEKVYASLSNGSLLASEDGGKSWRLLQKFLDKIERIVINERDTRIIYVALTERGIYRSSNAGETWDNVSQSLEGLFEAWIYRDMQPDANQKDGILYASNYGLFRSTDGGKNWVNIPLLSEIGKVFIFSVSVNPKNSDEIYYSTLTNFYHSIDGGKTWSTAPLPTKRVGHPILIDPKDFNTLYLGAISPL